MIKRREQNDDTDSATYAIELQSLPSGSDRAGTLQGTYPTQAVQVESIKHRTVARVVREHTRPIQTAGSPPVVEAQKYQRHIY